MRDQEAPRAERDLAAEESEDQAHDAERRRSNRLTTRRTIVREERSRPEERPHDGVAIGDPSGGHAVHVVDGERERRGGAHHSTPRTDLYRSVAQKIAAASHAMLSACIRDGTCGKSR